MKRGDRGTSVKRLQQLLGEQGIFCAADGIFGPATEQAVKEYQKAHGLTADGIVGIVTWSALSSRGKIVVQPETRQYPLWKTVRLWHAIIDRSVKPEYVFSQDPLEMHQKQALRASGIETWKGKRLTELSRGYLLAVNGGFFDTVSGWPIGPTIAEHVKINDGEARKPNQYAIVASDLTIIDHSPGMTLNAEWAFSTIPALVRGGKKEIGPHENRHDGRNPRSLLGWNEHHIHVVTIDGRSRYSAGVTMDEAANLLLEFGCTEGVNLDSGGSAEMVFNGSILNRPSDGAERLLPGAVAFRG